MNFSNMKQLLTVLTAVGISSSAFAEIQKESIRFDRVRINDERLVSILNNLIIEGRILYDPNSGAIELNDGLNKLMAEPNKHQEKINKQGNQGPTLKNPDFETIDLKKLELESKGPATITSG